MKCIRYGLPEEATAQFCSIEISSSIGVVELSRAAVNSLTRG